MTNYKCDIKVYGIEDRRENILKTKEILNLSDNDIYIVKKGKWPYDLCKQVFKSPHEPDVTHRLVLQDDCELCPDFEKYLQQIVNARPDDIFMLTALDFKTQIDYADNLKSPYVEVGQFVSGNAVIIPIKYIDQMFDWLDSRYPQISIGNPHEDAAFKFFTIENGLRCTTTVPSIVQHIGHRSSLCNYKTRAETYYFKDWDKADYTNPLLNPPYINAAMFEEYRRLEDEISESDEVRYFVRTTGEREFDYGDLPYIKLYDYYHKPVDSFIQQLWSIGKYNSVLLEDDLALCKNFKNEIEAVIKKYPNCVIQFFTDPGIYENTFLRSAPFEWNQCTYYPKGVARQIAMAMKKLKPYFSQENKLYSKLENLAMMILHIPHIVYRPCLVQHMDNKSILQPENTKTRATIWFKDYLDEAGFDYNTAYTREKVERLKEIRDKHFKEFFGEEED